MKWANATIYPKRGNVGCSLLRFVSLSLLQPRSAFHHCGHHRSFLWSPCVFPSTPLTPYPYAFLFLLCRPRSPRFPYRWSHYQRTCASVLALRGDWWHADQTRATTRVRLVWTDVRCTQNVCMAPYRTIKISYLSCASSDRTRGSFSLRSCRGDFNVRSEIVVAACVSAPIESSKIRTQGMQTCRLPCALHP